MLKALGFTLFFMTGPKKKAMGGHGPRKSTTKSTTGRGGTATSTGRSGNARSGAKRNTAQGRGGVTRDSVRPVRERIETGERSTARGSEVGGAGRGRTGQTASKRPSNPAARAGNAASAGGRNPARQQAGTESAERAFKPAAGRKAPPKVEKRAALPELRRVKLDAPPPETVFKDRDGEKLVFPDSNLKRMAAQILTQRRKAWRYRPFSFPLFTDKGNEQTFNFDFYIYDAEDSVIKLILVLAHESREVWDRVGRFKRQYPMYSYELWTPEKLAKLSGPRAQLGF